MNIMNRKSVIVEEIPVTLNNRLDKEREADLQNGVKIKYEARIYNKLVREFLEEGERNTTMWSDSWAEPHYESVYAATAEEAIEKIGDKFPERGGFVITDLIELDDERWT